MEDPKLGVKEQNLTVGDGFIGMLNAFVDPAGLAKRVPAPLSWLWPLITLTIIYLVFGYLMLPYTMALIDLRINQQLGQQNTPPEQASFEIPVSRIALRTQVVSICSMKYCAPAAM